MDYKNNDLYPLLAYYVCDRYYAMNETVEEIQCKLIYLYGITITLDDVDDILSDV